MPRLSQRELAEARRARADALHMLARLHHPAGYEIQRHPGLYGYIDRSRKLLIAPPPRTAAALYVNLYLTGIAAYPGEWLGQDAIMPAVEFARETMDNGGVEPPDFHAFTHDWGEIWVSPVQGHGIA